MLYITGDIHGNYDIHKLNTKNFPEQKLMTREDYVLICGDFGVIWNNDKEDKYWMKWLNEKNFTTLWIDGNHENFDLLAEYPIEDWKGGLIQKVAPNVYHLCRGSIFDIDGIKVFAFGGAESHDKQYREWGVSLWEQELPSFMEMRTGKFNLEAVDNKVDLIVTHSAPTKIQTAKFTDKYFNSEYAGNELTDYFDTIYDIADFKQWFTGHYHIDEEYAEDFTFIFDKIYKVVKDDKGNINKYVVR